jgi:hypothetical protein
MSKLGYTTCKHCKEMIDIALRTNALLFANLGSDCSKTAYKEASIQERKNLREVRKYDPEKIDRLLHDKD